MAERDRKQRTNGSGEPAKHQCPICRRAFVGEIETFPFCSKRCRMVDLGKWFSGSYAITRPMRPDDENEID